MATKKLPIAELKSGMLLGQEILDAKGRVVVQNGARLTPMYIKRLEKWGVDEVLIEEEEATSGETVEKRPSEGKSLLENASSEDREFMRRVALAAQERFSNIKDNPVMDELKRLAIRHLVMSGRGAVPGLR